MKKYLKLIIPIIFISLLTFLGYQIVTKINHKKEVAANIKTIPTFKYQNINGEQFSNNNLKVDTPIYCTHFSDRNLNDLR
jgi:hypothetical protein